MKSSAPDKQLLIKKIEDDLYDKIPAGQSNIIREALLNVLNEFDVTKRENIVDPKEASSDLLSLFVSAKTVEGRSPKTITHYQYILNQFFGSEKVSARETTVFHVRDYFLKEKQRGISDSTIAGIRDVLNSFFGWLFNEGLITKNPCVNISTIFVEQKVKLPFSNAEIEKIKEACKTDRDRAIVEFLRSTGCRVSEMCGLNRASIDFQNGECIVRGKGNKQRTVFVDDVAMMWLKRYIQGRFDHCTALFAGKFNERLLPGGVRNMLKTIEKRSGVGNVHPHRFRRTLATNLINRGMPIQRVAAILGHNKIETTMRYIYQNKETIRNEYRKYTA